MSYCSKGDESDVYVFSRSDVIYCHRCTVNDATDVRLPDAGAALAHLERHQRAGDQVPAAVIERLQAETEAVRATLLP